ncbi:MAG: DUF4290 domain-containing protein [Bacteroidota bacterium]
MEYNSQKEILIMPEYGRNVQLLIQHCVAIEDPAYRQAFAERIVDLMYQMNPQNKNVEDYRLKLWRHLFYISDFKIDVQPLVGDIPRFEDARKKPDRVGYPHYDTRFRHYGYNVQRMIEKAVDIESGPVQQGFINVIGSYMKLAYKTWLKEHYVSDDLIKEDLELLSGHRLSIKDDSSLDNLTNPQRRRNKRVSSPPANAPIERKNNHRFRKNNNRRK